MAKERLSVVTNGKLAWRIKETLQRIGPAITEMLEVAKPIRGNGGKEVTVVEHAY